MNNVLILRSYDLTINTWKFCMASLDQKLQKYVKDASKVLFGPKRHSISKAARKWNMGLATCTVTTQTLNQIFKGYYSYNLQKRCPIIAPFPIIIFIIWFIFQIWRKFNYSTLYRRSSMGCSRKKVPRFKMGSQCKTIIMLFYLKLEK